MEETGNKVEVSVDPDYYLKFIMLSRNSTNNSLNIKTTFVCVYLFSYSKGENLQRSW